MFRERLVSKAAQLALLAGKTRRPGRFVFKLSENLRGDGVLLIPWQSGNLFEGFSNSLVIIPIYQTFRLSTTPPDKPRDARLSDSRA